MYRYKLTADMTPKLTPEQEKLLKRIRVAEARRLLAQLEKLPRFGS